MPRGWLHWKKFDRNIITGGTVLNQDFKEFIRSLNDNNVRYLVVGGYAVAFYGYPRFTKDIDIFFRNSELNVKRIKKALILFGFTDKDLPDELVSLH